MDKLVEHKNDPIKKQLQNLVEAQHKEIVYMKCKLKESKSKVDFSHFEALVKELKDEKSAHIETRRRLLEAEEKLVLALGEVELLRKQLKRDRLQYETTVGTVTRKALRESRKNVQLENHCHRIKKEAEKKAELLEDREKHIQDLSAALHQSQDTHNKEIQDFSIQQQQQQYINKVLEGYDHKARHPHDSAQADDYSNRVTQTAMRRTQARALADYTRDISREHTRDSTRDYRHDSALDHTRDISRDHTRDSTRDYRHDSAHDHTRDTARDYTRDSTHEAFVYRHSMMPNRHTKT